MQRQFGQEGIAFSVCLLPHTATGLLRLQVHLDVSQTFNPSPLATSCLNISWKDGVMEHELGKQQGARLANIL